MFVAKSEQIRSNIWLILTNSIIRRLTKMLCQVTELIGAHILNISKQDYEPQGASVNILIAEQEVAEEEVDLTCNRGDFDKIFPLYRDTVHAHLDKSHVTVHTFPESHPENVISTFRVDIDVQTCGTVSPLKTLDFLISSFDSDIITIDYRVRGFTRDMRGKYFMDPTSAPSRYIDKYVGLLTLLTPTYIRPIFPY